MADSNEEFISSIVYFYRYKEDPTRYSGWCADRCQELMPDFFYHWTVYTATKKALDLIIQDHSDKLDE